MTQGALEKAILESEQKMIPRGKIDISYADILAGFWYCINQPRDLSSGENIIPVQKNCVYTLSLRSGFHLVLQAMNLPERSEILVTDISIPGMFEIIKAAGLIAVPLPVNKHTLSISAEQLEAAISPASKAVLFTHLFGSLMDLTELRELARSKGLVVIEDCAQAYYGNGYLESSPSDVLMFSFGMIKTNTALGGGMLKVKDDTLFERVLRLQDRLPDQHPSVYLKKLCLAFLIKMLTTRVIYSIFCLFLQYKNKDVDDILAGFTRGFPGGELLKKIRYRPTPALQHMLHRKISKFSTAGIAKRRAFALDILKSIPPEMRIGEDASFHSFWVLPIETRDPQALISALRLAGFDATAKASSLVRLQDASSQDDLSALNVSDLVYLPMWPAMTAKEKGRLMEVLIRFVYQ